MDIRFRQGLIALPANSLSLNDSGGIDVIISGKPILATVASGTVNYTISENRSIPNAWGPFSGQVTQYLFWQINQRTGEITRGATVYWPEVSTTPPSEIVGRMWWDSTSNKMKIWNGGVWENVLVVFAATLSSGGILAPQQIGSQVGITAGSGQPGFTTGYILKDGLGKALKTSNASEFLTSETPLLSTDTGSVVKMEGAQLVATANNPIAAFDAVYMVGNSLFDKASGLNLDIDASKAPIGIVTANTAENETAAIITAGKIVTNEQWSWSALEIGKSVYCDEFGQITLLKPSSYKNVRVGIITGSNSILLTFDWETDIPPQIENSGLQQVHVNAPLTKTGIPAAPMIGILRASETADGYLHRTDFARIVQLENQKANIQHTHTISDVLDLTAALNAKADTAHTHMQTDIQGLSLVLANKSDVGHTHAITDVNGLSSQLADIAQLIAGKANKLAGAINGNFAAVDASGNYYDSGIASGGLASAQHVHAISDVAGLQTQLDSKADTVHMHAIDNVAGLQSALGEKANAIHVHVVSDVTGLQTALDDKAGFIHAHAISDITGLQLALDSKATLVHSHAISDVIGLQLAIDSKADVVHVHSISDVTGLQSALDTKAEVVHSHTISQVSGLQIALDSKAAVNHQHSLASLSDVSVSSLANGDVLTWNDSAWTALPSTGGSGAPNHDMVNVPFYPFGTFGNVRGMRAVDHIFSYVCTANYQLADTPSMQAPIWRRHQLETFGQFINASVDFGLITDEITDYLILDPDFEAGNVASLSTCNNNNLDADPIKAQIDYGRLISVFTPPVDGGVAM